MSEDIFERVNRYQLALTPVADLRIGEYYWVKRRANQQLPQDGPWEIGVVAGPYISGTEPTIYTTGSGEPLEASDYMIGPHILRYAPL